MDTIKTLVIEPLRRPELRDIDPSITAIGKTIGGYAEPLPLDRRTTLWCDEEGAIKNLKPNRTIRLSQASRDVEHGLELAKSYCDSAEKQNRMLEILQFKLDILWSMLDAMTMAYALQRPPYHTVTDKAAWHTTRLV